MPMTALHSFQELRSKSSSGRQLGLTTATREPKWPRSESNDGLQSDHVLSQKQIECGLSQEATPCVLREALEAIPTGYAPP